jgi:hypothetical protein
MDGWAVEDLISDSEDGEEEEDDNLKPLAQLIDSDGCTYDASPTFEAEARRCIEAIRIREPLRILVSTTRTFDTTNQGQ